MHPIQLALRAVQFVWIILVTSLIGNVIDDTFGGSPSSTNYAMFVGAFCWIVWFIGVAGAFTEAVPAIVVVVSDALGTLFSFVAGVVLAARLRVHSCGNRSYIFTNQLTRVTDDPSKSCHELQASTAFFWFLFATLAASCALAAMNMGGGFRRSSGARQGPSMTQV